MALERHPLIRHRNPAQVPCDREFTPPGQALTLEEPRVHFTALQVARQKTPECLEIVAELPRTPSGKVKKFELRERLRASG